MDNAASLGRVRRTPTDQKPPGCFTLGLFRRSATSITFALEVVPLTKVAGPFLRPRLLNYGTTSYAPKGHLSGVSSQDVGVNLQDLHQGL